MSADDAERDESTEPEATEPEAPIEEPAAAAEASAEDEGAPTEPGAETEAEAEAGAVPEDVPESSEEESSLAAEAADVDAEEEAPTADAESQAEEADEPAAEEEAPAARKSAKSQEKKADVVPGADLEPIAISEERELTTEERARAEAEAEERAAREAAASSEDDDAEAITPRTVTVPEDAKIQATGKRKSAVARVIVSSGSGDFQINNRPIEQYFPSALHQAMARQALVSSGYDGNVDVRVRVHGGGISGQAGAVRHGVARALTTLEPELRGDLKRRGMLTRDDRRKERKKAGLKKARKRPQFSKR